MGKRYPYNDQSIPDWAWDIWYKGGALDKYSFSIEDEDDECDEGKCAQLIAQFMGWDK
jgi:hypothetical protein